MTRLATVVLRRGVDISPMQFVPANQAARSLLKGTSEEEIANTVETVSEKITEKTPRSRPSESRIVPVGGGQEHNRVDGDADPP
jgi:hypothetical protein